MTAPHSQSLLLLQPQVWPRAERPAGGAVSDRKGYGCAGLSAGPGHPRAPQPGPAGGETLHLSLPGDLNPRFYRVCQQPLKALKQNVIPPFCVHRAASRRHERGTQAVPGRRRTERRLFRSLRAGCSICSSTLLKALGSKE